MKKWNYFKIRNVMSYTEIFKFNKKGDAEVFAEVKNAFRGAMAVWNTMEEKYLPAIPAPFPISAGGRYYRSSDYFGDSIKEVWALFKDDKVLIKDRLVLGSTFDKVVVYRDDIQTLLQAFREFGGNTSLSEQADLIQAELEKDLTFLAIAWNQTSVNGDAWINPDLKRNRDGNVKPYNILKDVGHWSLT